MPESATPFPLKWPAGRPRRTPETRKYTIFRTSLESALGRGTKPITVAVALDRLEGALCLIKARYPVVSTNLEQLRVNGLPRSGQPEPNDPGVAVYFELGGKAMCLPCDTYSTVAGNIAAVAAHLDATRAIERYGVASISEMFAGFMALPSPDMERPWRDVLELRGVGAVTAPMVDAAYKRLARERHPDAGGSDAMMADLNVARAAAKRELST